MSKGMLTRVGEWIDRLLFGDNDESQYRGSLTFEEAMAEQIRSIEIASRRMVNDVLAGNYHSVFKGQGMEFAEVREYLPGDDIRDIDWTIFAATREHFVKVYTEERELSVMLMVDASASGDFGSTSETKRVEAARVCAMLAFAAIANQDNVGLLIFTDEVELYVPPKKGKKHVLRLIREIISFTPRRKGTNIGNALEHLNRVQRRRCVVFLLSDFLDKGYEDPLRVAAKRYDMVAISITDPLERNIVEGDLILWEDNETGEVVAFDGHDARTRRLYSAQTEKEIGQLDMFFKRNRIDYIPLVCGEEIDMPLIKFFKRRMMRTR